MRYGRKLWRGTDPWQENVTGEVSVKTPTLTVTRAQPKGGKPTLAWAHRDITGKENEDTRSKAQAALNDQIQEFAVWRNGSMAGMLPSALPVPQTQMKTAH